MEFWPIFIFPSWADSGLACLAELPLHLGSRPKNLGLGRETGLPAGLPRPEQDAREPSDQIRRTPRRPRWHKTAARPRPPLNPNSFAPSPSLTSHPTAAPGKRDGDGVGGAARAGGVGGAAEPCSPELRAAVAGAQLCRAPLVGAQRHPPAAPPICSGDVGFPMVKSFFSVS